MFIDDTCQLLILVIDPKSPEFALTIAAIPVVLILLITCGLAVKREIKWYVVIYLSCTVDQRRVPQAYGHFSYSYGRCIDILVSSNKFDKYYLQLCAWVAYSNLFDTSPHKPRDSTHQHVTHSLSSVRGLYTYHE